MSIVVAIPVKQSSGEQITEFISVVANDLTTWTYTTPQNHITVKNLGIEPITVTISAENITLGVGEWAYRNVTISEFSAQTVDSNSPLTNQINVVSIIDPPLPTAGSVTWAGITGKPAVIAAGADAASARTAIGAGTSNLAIGTTAGTAKAGDYAPPNAGAAVRGLVLQAATQANSAAVDVPGIVTDFNALLAKLKAAGQMA